MQRGIGQIVLVLSLTMLCYTPWTVPPDAVADGLRVEKRVDSRQGRRGDRRENTVDGIEDRHEFREGRRDSVGEGPEARVDNRKDKRGDRRDRTVNRADDRNKRVNKRLSD